MTAYNVTHCFAVTCGYLLNFYKRRDGDRLYRSHSADVQAHTGIHVPGTRASRRHPQIVQASTDGHNHRNAAQVGNDVDAADRPRPSERRQHGLQRNQRSCAVHRSVRNDRHRPRHRSRRAAARIQNARMLRTVSQGRRQVPRRHTTPARRLSVGVFVHERMDHPSTWHREPGRVHSNGTLARQPTAKFRGARCNHFRNSIMVCVIIN